MTTYRSRAADRQAVDDHDANRDLMCAANGCPHRWSVDAGAGRLCSFHAWAPAHRWPQITQERLDAMAERAHVAAQPKPPVPAFSREEKTQILRKLAEFVREPKTGGRRKWAHRIVERAEAGEHISPLVLKIARTVSQARKDAA